MSANNRPVCGFVRDYRLMLTDEEIHVKCPGTPTYAVLHRTNVAAPWQRYMEFGEFIYACDLHAHIEPPNACWIVGPLESVLAEEQR